MFGAYFFGCLLSTVMVSSAWTAESIGDYSNDPFMDPYIRTIVSMDSQALATIPKLNDDEFLQFLNDDSLMKLGAVSLKSTNFSLDVSRDKQLIYNNQVEEEWESLMVAGPLSIQYLSNLLVLSSKKDFSLQAANYSYQYMKFPHSFRTTLTQLSGDMFSTLMSAHTSMDKIRLNVAQMPNQIKTVFKLITSSSDAMIKTMLPRTLNSIARLASSNALISNATKSNFHQLQNLISEIIQVSSSTYSVHEASIDVIKEQQQNTTREQQDFENRLQIVQNQYERSKQELEAIRKQYNDVMKQAASADPVVVRETKKKGFLQTAINFMNPMIGAITCSLTDCEGTVTRVDNTKFENLIRLSQEIRTNLERAQAAHDQHYEDYLTHQNNLVKTINNMAALDLSKLNHEEIIDLLVKAIEQISEIENQWARLTRFFAALSNRAESLERIVVQDFVDFLNQANNNDLLEVVASREFFGELVFPVIESIEVEAHLLYTLSATYYDVSTKYMMNQIAGISRFSVLQTDDDRNNHLRQSLNTALATSVSITAVVRERSEKYLAEVEERTLMYTNYINGLSSK